MFARMSRYGPVAGGTTRHPLSRFVVQPGWSQHFLALSDTVQMAEQQTLNLLTHRSWLHKRAVIDASSGLADLPTFEFRDHRAGKSDPPHPAQGPACTMGVNSVPMGVQVGFLGEPPDGDHVPYGLTERYFRRSAKMRS
jgi:hypothetical protein